MEFVETGVCKDALTYGLFYFFLVINLDEFKRMMRGEKADGNPVK